MKYGIFIHGIAIGGSTPVDGTWLAFYDPTKNGNKGVIHGTTRPADALAFDSFEDAAACWRQSYGIRTDGRPNRPLTAYTIEIKPLPE